MNHQTPQRGHTFLFTCLSNEPWPLLLLLLLFENEPINKMHHRNKPVFWILVVLFIFSFSNRFMQNWIYDNNGHNEMQPTCNYQLVGFFFAFFMFLLCSARKKSIYPPFYGPLCFGRIFNKEKCSKITVISLFKIAIFRYGPAEAVNAI